MYIRLIVFFIVLCAYGPLWSQGVSFSYLIPKDGYISAPISPFSIRGIGLSFGDYAGFSTGGTLYSMSGLGMSDLPFDYNGPLTGPHFSILVPGQFYVLLPFKKVDLKLLAGGFGIWHINPRIHYGNMDRALQIHSGWDVVNARFEEKFGLGRGWMAGVAWEFYVSKKYSLTVDIQYLSGGSSVELAGSYSGGPLGGTVQTVNVAYKDARILLEGIELSFGANF